MFLTGCKTTEKNEYSFAGESEHWKATYDYEGKETWDKKKGKSTYLNEDSYEFVLTYKGPKKKLASMEKLAYFYQTSGSSGGGTKEFSEPPTKLKIIDNGSSKGGTKVNEDEVIHVTVNWDGTEEIIEMRGRK